MLRSAMFRKEGLANYRLIVREYRAGFEVGVLYRLLQRWGVCKLAKPLYNYRRDNTTTKSKCCKKYKLYFIYFENTISCKTCLADVIYPICFLRMKRKWKN
jgi:hypothetical protein